MTDVDIPTSELVDPVGIRFHPYVGPGPGAHADAVGRGRRRRVHRGRRRAVAPVRRPRRATSPTSATTRTRSCTLTRDLIALRTATPDLRTGIWRALDAPADVLAYPRGEGYVVALNLGDAPATVAAGGGTIEIATDRSRDGEAIGAVLDLAPRSGVVLRLT